MPSPMNDPVTAGAEHREVMARIELAGSSVEFRNGREVVGLDVALAELAVVLAVVKATDGAGGAMDSLGVGDELGVPFRAEVPAEASRLDPWSRLLRLVLGVLDWRVGVGEMVVRLHQSG